MTEENPGHDCPHCDRVRMNEGFHGRAGWVIAVGFFVLWLTDSVVGRMVIAFLIEWGS